MIKQLLFLTLIINAFFSLPCKAAVMVGTYKDFVEFNNRPLLIVLPVPFKEEQIAKVDSFNIRILKDIKQVWKINQEVVIMSYPEFKALKKSKDKSLKSKYAVLQFQLWEVSSGGSNRYASYVSNLNIGLSEKLLSNTFTYYHYFLNSFPSKIEFLSSLMQAQDYMDKCIQMERAVNMTLQIKARGSQLKNLTLLLDKNLTIKGLDEQAIRKAYSMPFKIVDSKEIEEAIRNKTSGYAYIDMQSLSLRDFNNVVHYVVQTSTGEIIGESLRSVYRSRGDGENIQAINLKDYAKYANQ